jgi:hypothetical protein
MWISERIQKRNLNTLDGITYGDVRLNLVKEELLDIEKTYSLMLQHKPVWETEISAHRGCVRAHLGRLAAARADFDQYETLARAGKMRHFGTGGWPEHLWMWMAVSRMAVENGLCPETSATKEEIQQLRFPAWASVPPPPARNRWPMRPQFKTALRLMLLIVVLSTIPMAYVLRTRRFIRGALLCWGIMIIVCSLHAIVMPHFRETHPMTQPKCYYDGSYVVVGTTLGWIWGLLVAGLSRSILWISQSISPKRQTKSSEQGDFGVR